MPQQSMVQSRQSMASLHVPQQSMAQSRQILASLRMPQQSMAQSRQRPVADDTYIHICIFWGRATPQSFQGNSATPKRAKPSGCMTFPERYGKAIQPPGFCTSVRRFGLMCSSLDFFVAAWTYV